MTIADGVDSALAEALRLAGLDTVAGAFAWAGGDDLDKPGLAHRRRTRLELKDHAGRTHELYMKRYGREPLGVRLKRRLTHGRRLGPAGIEFENVRTATSAGVPTMQAVAWGEQPARFGPGCGYIIVTAVPGDALERCLADFLERCGSEAVGRFTNKLAELVRRLHASGYVHRDLYASHVFLDESQDEINLYLIDLARMFRPRWRRFRWRVKDLAQLKYSMPAAWVEQYWDGFLAACLGETADAAAGRFSRAIDGKVARMRRRSERRRAAGRDT